MGDIADMILDGALCQACGTYIGDACDYPRLCAGCAARAAGRPHRGPPRVACPTCGRRVKPAGLADHRRDMHP